MLPKGPVIATRRGKLTGRSQDFEQQERWLRARARRSLDPMAPRFGRSGLLGMLNGAGVGVVVLPADDLAQPIEFEDELVSRIPERFGGYTANGVASLDRVTTTSDALIRFAPGSEGEGWRGFVAVTRSGGVECGVGTTSRYVIQEGISSASGSPVLRLYVLAHLVRVAVELQFKVIDWAQEYSGGTPIAGPFEVIVVVPDAEEMVLGSLNQGWEEPEQALMPPPRAIETNVTVRVQVDDWPKTEEGIEALMFRTLDRACEAFGDRNQRYLNQNHGVMPKSYA